MEKKEAMKILKDFHDNSALFSIRTALDTVLPELKESEDERIRKAQLDYWRSVGGKEWHGVPVQEAIAWLEKQSKPMWSEEDEKNLNKLDAILFEYRDMSNQCYKDIINWLNSLKQRIEG